MGVMIRAGRHNLSTDRFLIGGAQRSAAAVRILFFLILNLLSEVAVDPSTGFLLWFAFVTPFFRLIVALRAFFFLCTSLADKPFHKMPKTTPIGLFPTTTMNRKNGVHSGTSLSGSGTSTCFRDRKKNTATELLRGQTWMGALKRVPWRPK